MQYHKVYEVDGIYILRRVVFMMVEMNIASVNLMRAQGLAIAHARGPHATPAAQEEPVSGGWGGEPFLSLFQVKQRVLTRNSCTKYNGQTVTGI